jgi:hypothetical protein
MTFELVIFTVFLIIVIALISSSIDGYVNMSIILILVILSFFIVISLIYNGKHDCYNLC